MLDLRDHAPGRHRQVDDSPYGGGAGMVIRVDVVCAALEGYLRGAGRARPRERRVAVLTPVGRQLTDEVVTELAGLERLTLLCGRYEGFDQRVHDHLSNDAISIGPYVLSGGEVAAMAVLDAVTRKLPGALGRDESHLEDSSRRRSTAARSIRTTPGPRSSADGRCPSVLLSGDHGEVARWREQAVAPPSRCRICDPRPGSGTIRRLFRRFALP